MIRRDPLFSPLFRCALSIALIAGASASAEPERPSEDQLVRVNMLLRSATDKIAIDEFVGAAPESCLPASQESEVCQWLLRDTTPGWRPLAREIETGDRVTLICELPLDGSARAPTSCSAHPRRSNRTHFHVKKATRKGRKARDVEAERKKREAYRELVDGWIHDAGTLLELSRLMGELPSLCHPLSDDAQTCLWRTNALTYGHGTVAIWIAAPVEKKVLLQCTLPRDGGPRDEGSCSAEVGS